MRVVRPGRGTGGQSGAVGHRAGIPPAMAAIAHLLIQANHARIRLTLQEAKASTPAGLKAFDQRHKAADAAVEVQVKALRMALGLPPPATS